MQCWRLYRLKTSYVSYVGMSDCRKLKSARVGGGGVLQQHDVYTKYRKNRLNSSNVKRDHGDIVMSSYNYALFQERK
jgi:hypothetical protein